MRLAPKSSLGRFQLLSSCYWQVTRRTDSQPYLVFRPILQKHRSR